MHMIKRCRSVRAEAACREARIFPKSLRTKTINVQSEPRRDNIVCHRDGVVCRHEAPPRHFQDEKRSVTM